MKLPIEYIKMLECFDKAAFIADETTIVHANHKASLIGIKQSDFIKQLFGSVASAEKELDSRILFSARINAVDYTVTISDLGPYRLFTLQQDDRQEQIQSLLSAAKQLRGPLAGVISSMTSLMQNQNNTQDPDDAKQWQQMSKNIFVLQRSVRNMADLPLFLDDRSAKKETVEIVSRLKELCENIQSCFLNSEIRITYTLPDEPIYTFIDIELVERAVYNMVSNSIKAGSKNIQIKLSNTRDALHLTVSDDGCGIANEEKSEILSKFKEHPQWNINSNTLGLGMMIIFAAATNHSGALLLQDVLPHGCSITLTMMIDKQQAPLRQNAISIKVDAIGGMNTALIELSDILPNEQFL